MQAKRRPPELLDLQPGDAAEVTWTIDCSVDGSDIRGPYIQGRPGDRFIYLSWGSVDDGGDMEMFRRAKLMLADVPAAVLDAAAVSGLLVGRLGLTDGRGNLYAQACGRRRSAGSLSDFGALTDAQRTLAHRNRESISLAVSCSAVPSLRGSPR